MVGYPKRGEEEDIADLVRKKFDKIRTKTSKEKDFKDINFEEDELSLVKKKSSFRTSAFEEPSSIDDSYQVNEAPLINETSPIDKSSSINEPSIMDKPSLGNKFSSNKSFISEKETEMFPTPIEEPSPPAVPLDNEVAPVKLTNRLPRTILTLSVIVFLLAVIVVAFVLFWMYRDSSGGTRELSVNEDLQSAVVNNEETAYVVLSGDLDINTISSVSIVFSSSDDSTHTYSPTFISGEYEINASEIDLESFKDVIVARAFLDYKPSSTSGNETADLSGSAASLGPFVRFWENVRDFLS